MSSSLKVCHLSTSDHGGGAAQAALRLHKALLKLNLEGTFLCSVSSDQNSTGIHPEEKQDKISRYYRIIDYLISKLFRKKGPSTFSFNLISEVKKDTIQRINQHDVLILYWVGSGFISPEMIRKIEIPIIWRLSDMWPFTGGCHYAGDCNQYLESCSRCPQLGLRVPSITKYVLSQKRKSFCDIHIVAPSKWIQKCANKSHIFKDNTVQYIPTGVRTDIFSKQNQSLTKIKKPNSKYTVCFGATDSLGDPRKGGDLLFQLLKQADKDNLNIQAIVFGNEKETIKLNSTQITYLGTLKDPNKIASAYVASDLFIAPYREDNLPNTVLESLSCGIPVLSFNIGGIPDVVEHKKNGYLASENSIEDLYEGLKYLIINDLSSHSSLLPSQEFDLDGQAKSYHKLIKKIAIKN